MFSGIIEEVGTVTYQGPRADEPDGVELRFHTGITGEETRLGDSIAVIRRATGGVYARPRRSGNRIGRDPRQ